MSYCFKVIDVLDLDKNKKTDADSLDRVGRIVKLSEDEIKIGERLFVECIQPGFMKSFFTSPVVAYSPIGFNNVVENKETLVVWTRNSGYLFEFISEGGMAVLD